MKVEFCYSTVVFGLKDNRSDEVKAELSLVNARLSKVTSTPKKPVGVRFRLFGEYVERSIEFAEKLQQAQITYEIIYKWSMIMNEYLIIHNGMVFTCPFETEEEALKYASESGFKPCILVKVVEIIPWIMTWQWIVFQVLVGLPISILGVIWMIRQIIQTIRIIRGKEWNLNLNYEKL